MLKVRRKQLEDSEYVFIPELPNLANHVKGKRTEDGVLESEAALLPQ
jgi:hypothetical protein